MSDGRELEDWGSSEMFSDGSGWLYGISLAARGIAIAILAGALVRMFLAWVAK